MYIVTVLFLKIHIKYTYLYYASGVSSLKKVYYA